MGMFDRFDVDDCDGQVKMFSNCLDVFKMNTVYEGLDKGAFSIKLQGGKWVNISRGMWRAYTEGPLFPKCYDKWGREWDWNITPY